MDDYLNGRNLKGRVTVQLQPVTARGDRPGKGMLVGQCEHVAVPLAPAALPPGQLGTVGCCNALAAPPPPSVFT